MHRSTAPQHSTAQHGHRQAAGGAAKQVHAALAGWGEQTAAGTKGEGLATRCRLHAFGCPGSIALLPWLACSETSAAAANAGAEQRPRQRQGGGKTLRTPCLWLPGT